MLIKQIVIWICEACLKGEVQECHTPGCALFLHAVDLPIYEELYTVLEQCAEATLAEIRRDPQLVQEGNPEG